MPAGRIPRAGPDDRPRTGPVPALGGAALTYAELLAEVDATAAWLAGLGIGRGDRLGVRLP
ncbi:MAG: hypothetical protein Q4P43_07675 [Corynebacterium sphenisci]|nr:hypothetical protein [Corynebacterium sphenisci]MDO5731472.1 hypothetical protein [Corynebacterium sphenisci]